MASSAVRPAPLSVAPGQRSRPSSSSRGVQSVPAGKIGVQVRREKDDGAVVRCSLKR